MPHCVFGRRTFLLGAMLGTAVLAKARPTMELVATQRLTELENQVGGRIGVLALNTANGARLAHRENERFAMCSTFKWLLAALILSEVERGKLTLTQKVPFTPNDLFDHAPVVKAHINEGELSVETLTQAIVEVSDNTAANLLLRLIDGPAGLTRYLRKLGDDITRLDRFETELNSNLPSDQRDTTTPAAMVSTMQTLLTGNALNTASREKLIGWMKTSSTGLERLRASLPGEWSVGDKTGTGANGAVNDVAIIWPPKRAPILVAVYMSGSTRPLKELNALHAEIGRMVAEYFRGT